VIDDGLLARFLPVRLEEALGLDNDTYNRLNDNLKQKKTI